METNDPLDKLFAQAREQQPKATYAETAEQFKASAGSGGVPKNGKSWTKFASLKNGIIMLSIFTTIAAIVWFSATSSNQNPAELATSESKAPVASASFDTLKELQENYTTPPLKPMPQDLQIDPIALEELFQAHRKVSGRSTSTFKPFVAPEVQKAVHDSVYAFPQLNEDEIAANKKQKKRMLKALIKRSKQSYSFVPSGSFNPDGKAVSVQAFHMQSTEISLLEYRTFLFDLLIQGRKEEFLIAKPNQEKWIEYAKSMQPMTDLYFSHPAYNQYPVNNISRAGAQLYCKWLTEEARKTSTKEVLINDVRLPSANEWRYAASSGGKNMTFTWSGSNATNLKGCYLANFWPYKNAAKACEGCDSSASTIAQDGGFFTVAVDSYIPNDFGLYNMCGNLAEMVDYHKSNGKLGALGGGWLSTEEEIRLDAEDQYIGVEEPNLNIGFRVVISYGTNFVGAMGQ